MKCHWNVTRVCLTGAIILLTRLGVSGAAEPTPKRSDSPARGAIGQELEVDVVHGLFLFDHMFMKSPTAVSRDYLKRMADPASVFHSAYLQWKKGEINRTELIQRLPHVAMIGDSLSKNAYVSSIPSTFWRARTERRRDWFLDTDPSPASVHSVFERLEPITPLVATEYSGVGALVDSGEGKEGFVRALVRTRNFSGQVSQILRKPQYPDLLLLWIGHNNLNWAEEIPLSERQQPEKQLQKTAKQFREDYTRQVRRLVSRAQQENHKVAMVVFGLVNFEAFFKASEAAEALRAGNPKLYPYLEVDYQHYVSMKPIYRKNMIRLALLINTELQSMVDELNREPGHSPHVQLRYSDALATVDISRVELIHAKDAWHPSVKGHTLLAEAAFSALHPSLRFIGIEKESLRSGHSQLAQERTRP